MEVCSKYTRSGTKRMPMSGNDAGTAATASTAWRRTHGTSWRVRAASSMQRAGESISAVDVGPASPSGGALTPCLPFRAPRRFVSQAIAAPGLPVWWQKTCWAMHQHQAETCSRRTHRGQHWQTHENAEVHFSKILSFPVETNAAFNLTDL